MSLVANRLPRADSSSFCAGKNLPARDWLVTILAPIFTGVLLLLRIVLVQWTCSIDDDVYGS